MSKLLFGNVCAAINLNGSLGGKLSIEKDLTRVFLPYLFLIMGEVLMYIIKKVVAKGRMKGITLPGSKKQQLISQYDDNFSLKAKGDK